MTALSLPAAKVHLNITGSDSDAELQSIITAAEGVLAQRVGPLEATAVSSRVHGCRRSLVLPVTPVISLTSVTPVNGTAVIVGNLDLDEEAGIVSYTRGAWFSYELYDVAYSAGRTDVPVDLMFGVKELVRHLWENSQRGPTARPGSAETTTPGLDSALPDAVMELVGPYVDEGIA